MTGSRVHRAVQSGTATGVGSLPHSDPVAAVRCVLEMERLLPFVPQLPDRDPREAMLPQWLGALPEVEVEVDGMWRLTGPVGDDDVEVTLDPSRHAGFATLRTALAEAGITPGAVKAQVTGPLTLGLALVEAGAEPAPAFARAGRLATAAARAVVDALASVAPHSEPVLFLDEPALVAWRNGEPPLAREEAVDLLSASLAASGAATGVHVCGDGDRRMAIEAGPDIVGFPVGGDVVRDGVALARFLDAGGWIAWGAVPTDRPVGERADHWWNELAAVWCDLTRAGCDPIQLRAQALVTPACGLAGHTEAQVARILAHSVEIGERVREQAIATRLSVGA